MENDLRKLRAEQSKTKMKPGFHYLGFIPRWHLYHHCLSWPALCHQYTQVHEICSGSLVTAGEPKWSLSSVSLHHLSCHDALKWPKERYQEPVLAAGERTGCVPCNLAVQIFRHWWWEIFKLSLQESAQYCDIHTYIYYIHNIYISSIIFTHIHKRSEKHLSFPAVWEIEHHSVFQGTETTNKNNHKTILKNSLFWAPLRPGASFIGTSSPDPLGWKLRFWSIGEPRFRASTFVEAPESPHWQWDALEVGRLRTSKSLCGWEAKPTKPMVSEQLQLVGCLGNEIKLFGLNISPISADHSDSFSPYFVTQDSEICQLPARFKLDRKSGKCHLFTSQGANPKVYPRGQKNEGKERKHCKRSDVFADDLWISTRNGVVDCGSLQSVVEKWVRFVMPYCDIPFQFMKILHKIKALRY